MIEADSASARFGDVAWLWTHSDLHSEWNVGSLRQWVMPAIDRCQIKIYYNPKGTPCAYVSWAWFSAQVEAAYMMNPRTLHPTRWQSGNRLWLIDMVAPFGDIDMLAHDLKYNLFPDKVGKALRSHPGSSELRVVYLHGADAKGLARLTWGNMLQQRRQLGAGGIR